MSAGSLALTDLTRRFGDSDTPAVDHLTLQIPSGELMALVGASGSGKTTTLRIAAGYEAPDAGTVSVIEPGGATRDITRVPPERRGFGMVFQHYALFPHMSVEENVAFGLEARGVGRRDRLARARAALSNVGLEGAGPRAVQSLSGGEQQRVALARALIIEPRVLLLDEPLSNLDPTLRQSTRDELRGMLRRLGVTALFVTHDQEDAFAIADRVALLRRGKLLQVGAPEELYDRPATRDVAEFIGRATLVPASVDDGRAALAVAGVKRLVEVRWPDAASPTNGEALAVLRPEALGFTPADWPDVWPATVESRRFAGATYVYRARLRDGRVVEVSTPDRVADEGDAVGVRIVREPVPLVAVA